MFAKLLPLRGKHYGTVIELPMGEIKLWNATGDPSDREIESWGISREDWNVNVMIDDGWGGKSPARDVYEICDCHYESQSDYETALKLVEIINAHFTEAKNENQN